MYYPRICRMTNILKTREKYARMIVIIQIIIIFVLLNRLREGDTPLDERYDQYGIEKQNPYNRQNDCEEQERLRSGRGQHLDTHSEDDLDKTHADRLVTARKYCQAYSKQKIWRRMISAGTVWSYGGNNGIHYCITPKAGCTFWKRIFLFLKKHIPKNVTVSAPVDLGRRFVHYTKLTFNTTRLNDRVSMQLFSGGKMFMFARDPYSRLWSTYIDKFLLPDFWNTYGKTALNITRRHASEMELQCPKDMKFIEFLKFILYHLNYINEHWAQIHRMCSPCHVQFDVIGKHETFAEDSKYIFERYNLKRLVEENITRLQPEKETSMLINYNFALETKFNASCFRRLEIAAKLWKAFQFNGYIHKDTPFPRHSINETELAFDPKNEFSRVVFDVLKEQRKRGVKLKAQKREMMIEAYKKVPEYVIRRIMDVYRYDFELFGYEKHPEYLGQFETV